MDIKEYVVSQLGRTKNKKYEAYVVSRIIHLLDDFTIKFVTQQYVNRPEGRALTDLFFPQLGIHVEVDEGQHFTIENIKADKVREADIINATGHEILRVDVTKDFDEINVQINDVVEKIRNKKKASDFIPWDIEVEFSSETYVNRGYIDIKDDVAFRTIKDACNCFGHNYDGYQRAGAIHPDPEILIWFPKLYPNGDWDNQISSDERIITERNVNSEKDEQHVLSYTNGAKKQRLKRIVFARVKGNLGDVLYRFRGLYELDLEETKVGVGLVWKRISTRVQTYKNCG